LTVTSLPDGERRYLNNIRSCTTVSNLTPNQIHEIGPREIDRIEAEMQTIRSQRRILRLAIVPQVSQD
jgi:uncharacterized protein (DUF885 family)